MHQTMEIYMARKKRVPGHYNPDSNRIFDNKVTDDSLGDSRINKLHTERARPPPPQHPREPERRNCPHPWHSRFLRHDVRLLNEPICVMATESTDPQQDQWWPLHANEETLKKPKFSKDSTQRSDYQKSAPVKGNTRHSSNPFTIPSKGILPVNEPQRDYDPGKVLMEKISYAHNYDSRWDRNEPVRGKLHGSFVWDEVLKNDAVSQEVVTPWNRPRLHRCMTVPAAHEPFKPPKEKENTTPPVSNEVEEKKQESKVMTPETKPDEVEKQINNTQVNENIKNTTETIPSIDGLPEI